MKRYLYLIALLLIVCTASGVVYHVPADYTSIQAALNVCAAHDTVSVAPGIYQENISWPLVDGITLIGDGNPEEVIVDAAGSGRPLGIICAWDNPLITTATKIFNFTFRNGNGNMNGPGLALLYSSPVISNCIITRNYAPGPYVGAGGGLYCYHASPQLTDVIIVKNTAYSGGGVTLDPGSSPTFTNCVIADNTLSTPGGSYAAGVYGRYEVYPSFTNCTFTRNNYFGNAALHFGEVTNPTLLNCLITDNEQGVLLVSNAGIVIQHSSITNNSSAGFANEGTGIGNVANCWWGSASGPEHANNPTGTGDLITGAATYVPWLNSPHALAPLTPPLNVGASSIADNSFTVSWTANPEANIDHYEVNYGLDSLLVVQQHSQSSMGLNENLTNLLSCRRYYVQVRAFASDGSSSWYSQTLAVQTTGTGNDDQLVSLDPTALSCYPNPFSTSTTINYELKTIAPASLQVYNLKGQLVRTLSKTSQSTGSNAVIWDKQDEQGNTVKAGIYLLRLSQNGRSLLSKVMVID